MGRHDRWGDDDDGPSTLDAYNEWQLKGVESIVSATSATASPVWSALRRPVARCEYCGRIRQRGEVQCAGCGVMR